MRNLLSRNSTESQASARMSALVLLGLLLLLTFFSEANAFTITDRATCKYVDPKTNDCKERTNQFDLADEWAFFWFRGTMETSDAGAKEAKFNLYDPDGQQFLGAPFTIPFAFPISAPKPGENVVGWIGIGISKANVAVGLMPGISITARSRLSTADLYVPRLRNLGSGRLSSP
jgi:hypothetical protein